MTTSHKWTAVVAVILLAASILAGRAWLAERDARTVADTTTKVANTTIADVQEKQREQVAVLQMQLDTLTEIQAKAVTPTQIVKYLPQVMPLPVADAPIREVTQAEAAETAALPDAPKAGDLVIPAASAKDFFDTQVTCKANALKLDSCTQTVANDAEIVKQKDIIIAADQTALKGGTFWHRFAHDAKIFGISAGVGIGIGYVAAHH